MCHRQCCRVFFFRRQDEPHDAPELVPIEVELVAYCLLSDSFTNLPTYVAIASLLVQGAVDDLEDGADRCFQVGNARMRKRGLDFD